ncbi:MAG: SDR family oxidoreductase [Hominenteromicrobium sp.]|uniref:SDR family oxidoreductase n=1 Tax=Hominenteromicrobium sp. TaxID=3073581 RepID=UPI0039A38231
MFDQYLVTGATGFLGRAVAEELVRRRAQVHALVLRDDPLYPFAPQRSPYRHR